MTHWWYITLAWRWLATWWWWSNRRHKSSAHGCIERTTTWRLHAGRMQSCITPHDCWKRLFSRLVQNKKKSSNIFKVLQTAWKKKIKQVKILFKTNKQNKTPQKIKNKTPYQRLDEKNSTKTFILCSGTDMLAICSPFARQSKLFCFCCRAEDLKTCNQATCHLKTFINRRPSPQNVITKFQILIK